MAKKTTLQKLKAVSIRKVRNLKHIQESQTWTVGMKEKLIVIHLMKNSISRRMSGQIMKVLQSSREMN